MEEDIKSNKWMNYKHWLFEKHWKERIINSQKETLDNEFKYWNDEWNKR